MTAVEIVTVTGNIAFWAAFLIVVWAMFRPDHRRDTRHVTELRRLVTELAQLRAQLDGALRTARNETPDRPSKPQTTPHN